MTEPYGRGNKKLGDLSLIVMAQRIKNKEISLRKAAEVLDISHVALRKRINKLASNEEEPKPENNDLVKVTKEGNIKVTTKTIDDFPKISDDLGRSRTIPDDTGRSRTISEYLYLSTSVLRGLKELVLKKKDDRKTKRTGLLNEFITEFERQKELLQ